MATEIGKKGWDDQPDNDILTPEGCRTLLHVGEKALTQLQGRGLPYVAISNSYRFVRTEVITWMAEESRKRRDQPPES